MTTVHPPQGSILWPRQWRSAMDAVTTPGVPRAFVVGAAGSGKTTLLQRLHRELAQQKRDVGLFDASAASGSRLPPSRIVLVDDLHLLTADHLERIRDRADDTSSALIVAARPWPLSTATRDIAEQLERTHPAIVLGHVSRADLATHRDGRALAPACVDRILEVTAGVAWLVAAAIDWHDDRDCADDPAHTELLEVLSEHVAHRLDRVTPEVRRLIELRAVSSHTAPEDEADDLALRGHAEGLLLRNGRPVPVVLTAVQSMLSAHRFFDLGAGTREFILDRARSAWASGRADDAGALVDAAIGDGRSDGRDDDLLADLSAGVWSSRGMMPQAHATYRAYPPQRPDSVDRSALAAMATGHLPERSVVETDSVAPTALRSAMEFARRGLDSTMRTDLAPFPIELLRAAELYTFARTDDPVPELPAVIAAAAAIHFGDTLTARSTLADALTGGHGGPWAQRRLLLWQAFTAVHDVRPADARRSRDRAHAQPGIPSPRDRLLDQAVQVALVRRYGDETALAAAWAEARPALNRVDIDLFLLLPLCEFVSAAAKVGDADSIEQPFTQALQLVQRLGEPALWSPHVHWAGIQRGILTNRPDALVPHGHALVAASRHSSVATALAHAGRVWTAVLAGTVDPDAVEESARALAAMGLAWDAARLAGHGAGRSEDRRISARLLACARELHPNDPTREVADPTTSGHSPDEDRSDPVSGLLSDREREVARLVLQGKTYAQIGEVTFISPRTVEHHIAHIRRRIGADSRSEMITKLRILLDGAHATDHRSADAPLPSPGQEASGIGVSPDGVGARRG